MNTGDGSKSGSLGAECLMFKDLPSLCSPQLRVGFGRAVPEQSHSSVLRRQQQGAYGLFSPLKVEVIWTTSGAAFAAVSQNSAASKESACVLPFPLLAS